MEVRKTCRSQNIVYYILGIVETLIGFRLLFKLLDANPRNGFVTFLYSLTGIFVAPFRGIFSTSVSSQSVFEPAAVIAMAVYAVIAYGIIRLFKL